MLHFIMNIMDAPSVNSGSGSFRKKDLSRLLITFRSCHLCGDGEGDGYYRNNLIKSNYKTRTTATVFKILNDILI